MRSNTNKQVMTFQIESKMLSLICPQQMLVHGLEGGVPTSAAAMSADGCWHLPPLLSKKEKTPCDTPVVRPPPFLSSSLLSPQAFFRRIVAVHRTPRRPCRLDGRCSLQRQHRNNCPACRYQTNNTCVQSLWSVANSVWCTASSVNLTVHSSPCTVATVAEPPSVQVPAMSG